MGKYAAQRVNHGLEDEMEIEGFLRVRSRFWITVLLVLLSAGSLLILLTWKKSVRLFFTHVRCSLQDATTVLLTDKDGVQFEETVVRDKRIPPYFYNKQVKYSWDNTAFQFYKISGRLEDVSLSYLHGDPTGLTTKDAEAKAVYYGKNIMHVPVASIVLLLVHEALNPFYLVQAYSFIVWTLSGFHYYALILIAFTIFSIFFNVWETRQQSRFLRDKVTHANNTKVIRNGNELRSDSTDLVPGDLIVLPSDGHYCMPCDAVLLNGSVTVNEAGLTGESTLIPKEAAPNHEYELFNMSTHRSHVLFCGSEVVQVYEEMGKVRARVISTSYSTVKGELIRHVLHQRPINFQFYSDLWKSIPVLFCLASAGAVYSVWFWKKEGASAWHLFLCFLDLLTYTAPPLLPAALTSINSWAQTALKKKGIYCISSKYITVCGTLDLICFDKTGTMTEASHDLVATVVANETADGFKDSVTDPTHLPETSHMVSAMAACQSLTKEDKLIRGYPLDIKIFESINWELQETNDVINPNYNLVTRTLVKPKKLSDNMQGMSVNDLEIAILKRFPFNPSRQTMSVISKKRHGRNFDVYIKGSAEKVLECCDSMTVPESFYDYLSWYESQGFMIVVFAWKQLEADLEWSDVLSMPRNDLEENAEFVGFIVLRNMLKPATAASIELLKEADITCVMVTGDALYTSINVAKESHIINNDETVIIVEAQLDSSNLSARHVDILYRDPEAESKVTKLSNKSNFRVVHGEKYVFALTGQTFDLLREYEVEVFKKIVHRGRVFARMLPEHKKRLVKALQEQGHQVGMCGDGCNDCGAMRAARAGVSVGMCEASLAASFTSVSASISCVPQLIRKGRATLVSAMCAFKYGVAVKITMLLCVLLSYKAYSHISDVQMFGYEFIGCAVPLLTLGFVKSYPCLFTHPPAKRIFHFYPLFSLLSFLLFQLSFQLFFLLFYTQRQPWNDDSMSVKHLEFSDSKPDSTYGQTSVFVSTMWGSVAAAVVFSQGRPYRRPFYTNKFLVPFLVLWFILVLLATVGVPVQLVDFLNIKVSPELMYQFASVGVGLVNVCLCYLWETQFIQIVIYERLMPLTEKIKWSAKPYEKIEEELKNKVGWPPIGPTYTEIKLNSPENEVMEEKSPTEKKPSKKMGIFSRGASIVSKSPSKTSQTEEDPERVPLQEQPQSKVEEQNASWLKRGRMSLHTFRQSIKNRPKASQDDESRSESVPLKNMSDKSTPSTQEDENTPEDFAPETTSSPLWARGGPGSSDVWAPSQQKPPQKKSLTLPRTGPSPIKAASFGTFRKQSTVGGADTDESDLPAPPKELIRPFSISMYAQMEDEPEMFDLPLPPPPISVDYRREEPKYATLHSPVHVSPRHTLERDSCCDRNSRQLSSFKPNKKT